MSTQPTALDAMTAALTLCVPNAPSRIVARAMIAALNRAGFEIVPSRELAKDCNCPPERDGCSRVGCPRASARHPMEASAA